MTIENYTGSKGKRTSRPAGKNDEFVIMPMIWTQILSIDNKKRKNAIVAEKGKIVESPLSTELSEGQSIKTYDDTIEKSQGNERE